MVGRFEELLRGKAEGGRGKGEGDGGWGVAAGGGH